MYLIKIFLLVFLTLPAVSFAAETFVLQPFQRQLSFAGFTRPKSELLISSEVSGRCEKVLVDIGESVAAGGVVVTLDKTFVLLDLQKNRIAQEQVERQLELDKKTVARYSSLIINKSTAQATYDEAMFQADSHAIKLKSLQNEEVRLRELLKRHTLAAPSGWKVIERFVEPGEFVRPGEPLLRLGDFRELLIPFVFTWGQLEIVEKYDRLQLYFPDQEKTIAGTVFRVAPGFDEKTRKIRVDVLVHTEKESGVEKWRGGMRVILQIQGTVEKNTFSVPSSALLSRYEAHWLVTEQGRRIKIILLEMDENRDRAVVSGRGLAKGQFFLVSPE
jgi:RND family efflux transporter MFP subunit